MDSCWQAVFPSAVVLFVQCYFTIWRSSSYAAAVAVVLLSLACAIAGIATRPDASSLSAIGITNPIFEPRTATLLLAPFVVVVFALQWCAPVLSLLYHCVGLPPGFLVPSLQNFTDRTKLAFFAVYVAWGIVQQTLYLPFFQLGLINGGVPPPLALLLSVLAFSAIHYTGRWRLLTGLTFWLGVWLHTAYCVSAAYCKIPPIPNP